MANAWERFTDAAGLSNHGQVEAAKKAYDTIVQGANATMEANQGDIDAYKAALVGAYGSDAGKYSSALQKYLDSDTYQNDNFNYSGNVSDFYDPYANQRVAAAMSAINNSSASGGNRFSSDYVNQVGAKQQALASEEWEKAYDKLMKDRSTQLQEWQANSQNQWNNYNAQQDKLKGAVDAYGNAQSNYLSALGDATSATVNNRNANLQTQASAVAGQANAGLQEYGAMNTILPAAAKFAGAFFGA